MNNQTLSAIRTLLTLLGSYFIGKAFFGLSIDTPLWQGIVGIVMAAIGVVWSLIDKSLSAEMWQGLVRHVITFASGIFIAKGIFTQEIWQAILAVLVGIAPWLQSMQSMRLNDKIKTGKVEIEALRS